MNDHFQDELISAIKTLLSEKYPDYIFEEIYEDSGIHFLNEKYIRIEFWDCVYQQKLWVGLSVCHKDLVLLSIEELIYRIDSELEKSLLLETLEEVLDWYIKEDKS